MWYLIIVEMKREKEGEREEDSAGLMSTVFKKKKMALVSGAWPLWLFTFFLWGPPWERTTILIEVFLWWNPHVELVIIFGRIKLVIIYSMAMSKIRTHEFSKKKNNNKNRRSDCPLHGQLLFFFFLNTLFYSFSKKKKTLFYLIIFNIM